MRAGGDDRVALVVLVRQVADGAADPGRRLTRGANGEPDRPVGVHAGLVEPAQELRTGEAHPRRRDVVEGQHHLVRGLRFGSRRGAVGDLEVSPRQRVDPGQAPPGTGSRGVTRAALVQDRRQTGGAVAQPGVGRRLAAVRQRSLGQTAAHRVGGEPRHLRGARPTGTERGRQAQPKRVRRCQRLADLPVRRHPAGQAELIADLGCGGAERAEHGGAGTAGQWGGQPERPLGQAEAGEATQGRVALLRPLPMPGDVDPVQHPRHDARGIDRCGKAEQDGVAAQRPEQLRVQRPDHALVLLGAQAVGQRVQPQQRPRPSGAGPQHVPGDGGDGITHRSTPGGWWGRSATASAAPPGVPGGVEAASGRRPGVRCGGRSWGSGRA